MLRPKAFTIVLHIAGWLLFLMFPLFFLENGQDGNWTATLSSLAYINFCLCYISLFYINAYLLIPGFFIQKKYIKYAFWVLVLFLGVFYLRPFDRLMTMRDHEHRSVEIAPPPRPPLASDSPHFPPRPVDEQYVGPAPRRIDITSLFIFILVMAFSMALRSIEQWRLTEEKVIRAEAEKAIAELSFLKAQINPHFLYNTLNNIYTLSVVGSDKTSDSIMKLSNIMRYVTDEAEADLVDLSTELSCINDFIDLQRLRLGKMVNLNYQVQGKPDHHRIPPLLLMTFIENVFKYGLSNHEPVILDIQIVMEGKNIIFHSQNQVFDRKRHSERSGIGIANTRKRLDYLYADKYQLQIDQKNDLFTVDLVLST